MKRGGEEKEDVTLGREIHNVTLSCHILAEGRRTLILTWRDVM